MADVKTFLEVKAKFSRVFYEFTDKDGVERCGVGVRVETKIDDENVRSRIDERDSKLVGYQLRKLGLAVIDNEGNVVPDKVLETLKK